MLALLREQLAAMSGLEAVAVVLAIAYLVLAIRQSIWCWPCAFASTAIYIWLFHSVSLFMESALNAFYLLMAVYGFMHWMRGGARQSMLPVTTLGMRTHLLAGVVIALLVVLSGSWLSKNTSQALPYVDAFTTWSAVWATWLTARKVLENWWYWLVIDIVSVGLFWSRGLPLTAGLFALYVGMIPFGYLAWRRDVRMPASVVAA